jgi:hypothetical protein
MFRHVEALRKEFDVALDRMSRRDCSAVLSVVIWGTRDVEDNIQMIHRRLERSVRIYSHLAVPNSCDRY